jgi:CheY-like chemotaxis protein
MRPDAVTLQLDVEPERAMSVLIVDDDVGTRGALAQALRRRGCTVREAATVAGALDAIGELSHDLEIAVLNYFLPRGEPQTAWSREASDKPATAKTIVDFIDCHDIGAAVLFLTGSPPAVMRHVVRGTRADGCLYKPFDTAAFLATFERVRGWHLQRGDHQARPVPTKPAIPVGIPPAAYAQGRLRVASRLAGIDPDDDRAAQVFRLAYQGERLETACKACGMSEATYKRATKNLRARLGIRDFGHDLTRCIDEALDRGVIEWWELMGYAYDPTRPRACGIEGRRSTVAMTSEAHSLYED